MVDDANRDERQRDTEQGGAAISETVTAALTGAGRASARTVVAPASGEAATIVASSLGAGVVRQLSEPLQEQSFGDRYADRKLLGAGGMGEVRLIADERIGREVAMKVLRSQSGGSGPAGRVRFIREARVQAQLEHPAIVPVYDMGLTPDGVEYFTMKRIGGKTLADIIDGLAANDPGVVDAFPRNKLLGAFRQVCLAVEYAHRRGVLHRDIKPQNLMLGDLGEVYVLDWGLAKIIDAASTEDGAAAPVPSVEDVGAGKSVVGSMLGTPGYMAPEQAAGSSGVDARTDVYALGAVLFEILTLAPLNRGATLGELLQSTFDEQDVESRMLDAGTPPELARLCAAATRLLGSERLESAQSLADGVQSFLDGDRDAELRGRLAERHAHAAREAATRARQPGGDPIGDRKRALQEAGRALALDPGSTDAAGTLMQLLLEPPPELPPEVVDAVAHEETEEARSQAAQGAPTYFVNGCIAILVGLIFGVRDLRWILLIFVPQWITALLCFVAARKLKTIRGPHILAIAAVSFFAIGADSGIAGPLILVPAYAAANLILLSLPPLRGAHRYVHLGLACATILVPVLLEYTGWITPAYVFSDAGIQVQPRAVALPAMALPLGAAAAIATALVGPAIITWRTADTMSRMRRQVQLQSWMLRQLIPRLPEQPEA